MNNIRVHTESPYEILVGSGLLRSCGQEIAKVHAPCRAAIITDDTVDSLYGAQTEASLRAAGYQVCKFVFAHGERSKCLQTALDAYEMLTANGISRSDLIVALGGGVVGDLAGFVAATYLRGVDFVQIPTTFLAAIDSSVGGKTAVDIPSGKNLVGAFWQPKQVICDTDTLSTLSEEIFSEGTAEAIKYGAILDESLYRLLASGGLSSHLEEVICRCVDLKRMLVEEDERDRGSRQLLNFGHTLGHCVETLSGYTVPHGRAVAIGMAMITRVSESLGLTPAGTTQDLLSVLDTYRLPSQYEGATVQQFFQVALGDKKRHGDSLTVVLLERIGKAVLHPIPLSELESFLSHAWN